MRDRSRPDRRDRAGTPEQATAADHPGKTPGEQPPAAALDETVQVVQRKCTICEWEAQLIERGLGEDPLCPWCYGLTVRASVLGTVVPDGSQPGKNPFAASLGRLGGLKGGPARAAKLTAKQRRDIAIKAARARWARRGKRDHSK